MFLTTDRLLGDCIYYPIILSKYGLASKRTYSASFRPIRFWSRHSMNQTRSAYVRHHTDRSYSRCDEIYAQYNIEDDKNITAMRFSVIDSCVLFDRFWPCFEEATMLSQDISFACGIGPKRRRPTRDLLRPSLAMARRVCDIKVRQIICRSTEASPQLKRPRLSH